MLTKRHDWRTWQLRLVTEWPQRTTALCGMRPTRPASEKCWGEGADGEGRRLGTAGPSQPEASLAFNLIGWWPWRARAPEHTDLIHPLLPQHCDLISICHRHNEVGRSEAQLPRGLGLRCLPQTLSASCLPQADPGAHLVQGPSVQVPMLRVPVWLTPCARSLYVGSSCWKEADELNCTCAEPQKGAPVLSVCSQLHPWCRIWPWD